MSKRYPSGFISAFYDPLKNPNAPTIGAATGDNESASVAFTAPTNVGGSAITGYGAVSNPEGRTATSATSPITVTGLTNGTAYTFAVWAINTYGPSAYSGYSGSATPALQRALFAGGIAVGGGSPTNTIQYVSISSTGNTAGFGELSVARYMSSGLGSATRSVFAGGDGGSLNGYERIDYVNPATTGNATDFGRLTANGRNGIGAASNSTRGLFVAGYNATYGPGFMNVVDYITIATTGNATDFGDTSITVSNLAAVASPTRVVWAAGYNGTFPGTMGYFTIASTGNSTSFGTRLAGSETWYFASACSSTRGLFAGGSTQGGYTGASNTITYITIATTGNSISFGDLTVRRWQLAGTSSGTRAIFAGGADNAGAETNVIDFVTIASTGNASDFGDLGFANPTQMAGTSNCHGGLS
jgi:hypothetical protein